MFIQLHLTLQVLGTCVFISAWNTSNIVAFLGMLTLEGTPVWLLADTTQGAKHMHSFQSNAASAWTGHCMGAIFMAH